MKRPLFISVLALAAVTCAALVPAASHASQRASWDPYAPPADLGALTQRVGQSVVTLYCGKTPVSAWAADIKISDEAASAGYKTYLITTYSAMSSCMYEGKRFVEMRHRGMESLAYVWAWDKGTGLAAVYTNQVITPLKWFGMPRPVTGAWVGAVGSSNGSGVTFSTGSVTSVGLRSFESSVSIGQSSSGGPVVDNQGRIVGMSTTESSGRNNYVAGTPLLCVDLINCSKPLDVWVTLTVPSAPLGVTAVAGAGSATVSWRKPVSDGGSPVTSYTAVASPGGMRCVTASLTCAVSGLSNGTSYTFTVYASNSMGDGAISIPSTAVLPKAPLPTAVRILKAVPGKNSVTVTWLPPGNSAVASVSSYEYRVGATLWMRVPTARVVITGLTKGRPITIQVRAVGASGAGAVAAVSSTPR